MGGRHHRLVRLRLLLATGLAIHALPAPAAVVPGLGRALRIPMGLDAEQGVALTFDDGPHPEGTAAALEMLARESVPATFFSPESRWSATRSSPPRSWPWDMR